MRKQNVSARIKGLLCCLALCLGVLSIQSTVTYAASTSVPLSPLVVEAEVREFFSDVPEMIEIARCESGFRQYQADGSPLWGGLGNGMVGVFQVYKQIHAHQARSLGYDLRTLAGNLGYARYLYELQGTSPWNSSAQCWRTAGTVAEGAQPKPLLRTSVLDELAQENEQAKRAALLVQIKQLLELVVELQALVAAQRGVS